MAHWLLNLRALHRLHCCESSGPVFMSGPGLSRAITTKNGFFQLDLAIVAFFDSRPRCPRVPPYPATSAYAAGALGRTGAVGVTVARAGRCVQSCGTPKTSGIWGSRRFSHAPLRKMAQLLKSGALPGGGRL